MSNSPGYRTCRAAAEIGSHSATLRPERAVSVEELQSSERAIGFAADNGWVLFQDDGARCYLGRPGVDAVSEWVEEGEYPSGDRIRPETMAKLRPRFGGPCEGLFLETHGIGN